MAKTNDKTLKGGSGLWIHCLYVRFRQLMMAYANQPGKGPERSYDGS